jgi:hypothetical protein
LNETDCRSEVGITVGLIDSIISISRVLSKRSIHDPAIKEALMDLAGDEDLGKILSDGNWLLKKKEMEEWK